MLIYLLYSCDRLLPYRCNGVHYWIWVVIHMLRFDVYFFPCFSFVCELFDSLKKNWSTRKMKTELSVCYFVSYLFCLIDTNSFWCAYFSQRVIGLTIKVNDDIFVFVIVFLFNYKPKIRNYGAIYPMMLSTEYHRIIGAVVKNVDCFS